MMSIKTNWQSTFLANWDSWNDENMDIEEAALKDFIDQAIEITSLNLSFCRKITVDGFDYLVNSNKVQNLTRLNLKGCEITDVSITKIVRLTNLIMLDLTDCRVTNANLKIIATRLTQLETLKVENCGVIDDDGLWNCEITSTGFKTIALLTNLTELNVARCYEVTDGALEYFAQLPHLENLNLQECSQVGNKGLRHLAKLQKMKTLNLGLCRRITDEGLKYLGELGNLESLNLGQCYQITGQGLKYLGQLPYLTSLNLSFCRKITVDGFDYLVNSNKVQNLTRLNLKGCEITDVFITKIVRLTNLIMLDLTDCRVTNANLKIIVTQLTKLKTLKVENCREIDDDGLLNCEITFTGFKTIALLTNLTELSVARCYEVTDGALEYFAQLPHLENLNLQGCYQVGNEGLRHLAKLQKMKTLNLSLCKKITDEGLKYLGELGNLESLNLGQCYQITGQGLKYLGQLPYLTSLNLRLCPNIMDKHLKLYLTDARDTSHLMKVQEVFKECFLLVPDLYRCILAYMAMLPIRVKASDIDDDHEILY